MSNHIIIDRRKNAKGKSTENRLKFFKRVKEQIRDAVSKDIRNGKISDVATNKNKEVVIPGKGLQQPNFDHSPTGGIRDNVLPGNKKFIQGDRLDRPPPQNGGKNASNSGDGEDKFKFSLTKKEFLDIFFEDLGLPNLSKKAIAKDNEYVNRRAGFSVDGNPSRLNILRSLKSAKGRLISLRAPKRKKIRKLKRELQELELSLSIYHDRKEGWKEIDHEAVESRIAEINEEIATLKRKEKAIPFIDDFDLRFNRWERVSIPSTRAVMFAIMDVSGSMGDWEKEMAKRFFMLLYLFLARNYERVDIIFIRHHTIAKEVDEEEFFYSRETGGTVVSSALEKMSEIIKDRYPPTSWNIYACQASDGDDWPGDLEVSKRILRKKILPTCQYYAYVEIKKHTSLSSDLWPHYTELAESIPHFVMTIIDDVTKIFPIFRGLFNKKG